MTNEELIKVIKERKDILGINQEKEDFASLAGKTEEISGQNFKYNCSNEGIAEYKNSC